ncbi:MAG: ribonuclease HI [Holosporales bacterium]|nr:ribonuclease HI [Holosporales bacterium]
MENTTKRVEIAEFIEALSDGGSVSVYTDGACSGNPGPGGWGSILIRDHIKTTLSGFDRTTTNNRMELLAVIEALRILPTNIKIVVYTDSSYVLNGITKWMDKWRASNWTSSAGTPIKNQDLWCLLLEVSNGKDIDWIFVKGHTGCSYNEDADVLAKSAIVTSIMRG